MTRIAAVSGVLPPHRYAQSEITDALAAVCLPPGADRAVFDRLHACAGVRHRHLALELPRYGTLSGFGEANDLFIETALDLGERAVRDALDAAGLRADEVDLVLSTSVTGIAAPSVEARLAGRLGLRPDVKRLPVFGLGCVAGAAGLARLHDHLTGHPADVAVLLSTELCSLTLQRGDTSAAGMVAGALFGDGGGALVAVGTDRAADHTGPVVLDTRSRLYPGTGDLLGWDIGDRGFRIVLGGQLPDVVRLSVAEEVRDFLAGHDLKPDDVTAWICHPGGPKVLDALQESLGLPADALEASRRSLAEVGNLSSASVLHILRDVQADRRPPPGATGLLLALGPGLSSELVLLRW
ncbi:type III polyketide synthase [Streptantibioticus silvisoli]|uniref:3-oxoacyl-[acyl-carrier-protein] synthase III C-terminal domain-containing protein n=1 Tax=Streptantibioticus silvisoli TaxID=2705255 RepID=A0ABT6VX31_9ACTN|nr:3-oxoacyl-[acyl-carrier-protein] synthase III C-terminal domain-containing protein [Streptantibioticus silvisoli]MDI5963043.1 3-oxoacyl-[acyl-carrier-protein] synthase III C-terminal domain-containing protein [Streptantibioticus silvisoli]